MKIIKISILFLSILTLYSCSSVNYPSIEESEKSIAESKLKISMLENEINTKMPKVSNDRSLETTIAIKPINKILEKIAFSRNDDLKLKFSPSPAIYIEEKSTLGIKYTNQVDLNSGNIDINLKSLKFNEFKNNKINANIEIEGLGKVDVSVKYMGLSTSAKPDVQMYLNEQVTLDVKADNKGNLTLKPLPKKLILKAAIKLDVLGWKLPYYREIELELTEILKPITIPLALTSDFQLPVPAEEYGKGQIVFKPYTLEFSKASVKAENNKIEYQTDIDLKKK